MKLFADMHVHSKFSIDGTSTMEEYCLTAEKTGSRIICFTEHVDFNSMEKNLSIIKDTTGRVDIFPSTIDINLINSTHVETVALLSRVN